MKLGRSQDVLLNLSLHIFDLTRTRNAILKAKILTILLARSSFKIAARAGSSREELAKIRKQEMFLEDRRGAFNFAKREGREEGRLEGKRSLLLRHLGLFASPLAFGFRPEWDIWDLIKTKR